MNYAFVTGPGVMIHTGRAPTHRNNFFLFLLLILISVSG
jgi:hypothetical protein